MKKINVSYRLNTASLYSDTPVSLIIALCDITHWTVEIVSVYNMFMNVAKT